MLNTGVPSRQALKMDLIQKSYITHAFPKIAANLVSDYVLKERTSFGFAIYEICLKMLKSCKTITTLISTVPPHDQLLFYVVSKITTSKGSRVIKLYQEIIHD